MAGNAKRNRLADWWSDMNEHAEVAEAEAREAVASKPAALDGMTLDDVVAELQDLRIDVRRASGRLRDTFWGVTLGITVGVPLVVFVLFVVLAVVGVSLTLGT